MQAILDVLQHYRITRAKTNGKRNYTGDPDQVALTQTLPDFFRQILQQLNREQEFRVHGSFGEGMIANVPWVGIFKREITTGAKRGYYIVLLFAENMQSCSLSFNQGFTSFEKQFGRMARGKLKETAYEAIKYIQPPASAKVGPINLAATGKLGRGYESGAIVSFDYSISALPNAADLERDFRLLLGYYDLLHKVAGTSLQTLVKTTEIQYQKAVLESAAQINASTPYIEPPGGIPIPDLKASSVKAKFQRNPRVAARALHAANHVCEVDPKHKTFISSAKSLPYVEAHHLIPIGYQASYKYSLDVLANIVSLCPMCHKLLHHGKAKDKEAVLIKLLNARSDRLAEKI